MIKIRLVSNDKKEFLSFEAAGHAGNSNRGQDIVCSAVTILLKTVVLSLKENEKKATNLKTEVVAEEVGYLKVRVETFSDKDRPLLFYLFEFLTIGLMAIKEEYPDCLDLQIEPI